MQNIIVPYVSKLGLQCSALFLLFIFLYRILLPFGDEPDFLHRSHAVFFGDHPWWSPYSVFNDLFGSMDIYSKCQIDAGVFSFWASIDSKTCSQPVYDVSLRLLTTFLISLPLLFIIVFPRIVFFINNITFVHSEKNETLDLLRILSVTILSSGILYSVGVLAEEQFVLVLSLLSFVFWRSKPIILVLFVMILSIDKGASIVFLSFFTILYTLNARVLSKLLRYKKTFIFLFVLLLYFFTAIGVDTILGYSAGFFLFEDKAASVLGLYDDSALLEKYPVFLRPVITFMTAILALPSGVKNVFGIFVSFCLVVILLVKSHRLNTDPVDGIFLKASLITILFFIFLFPTYANAKYYIWLSPFILKPLLFNTSLKKSLVFFLMLSSSNLILLFLFRL